mmetsp:Transcript_66774/g.186261  ORF Transcript_66774/g.186261 Transcript_66774/m.186261 type:complete len:313 (+) Transcript_66774:783-1721(+)
MRRGRNFGFRPAANAFEGIRPTEAFAQLLHARVAIALQEHISELRGPEPEASPDIADVTVHPRTPREAGGLFVHEDSRAHRRYLPDELVKRRHRQGRSEHDKQVAMREVRLHALVEVLRKALPEENNVWFHERAVLLLQVPASVDPVEDSRLQLRHGHLLALERVRLGEVAMCGDDLFLAQPRKLLEHVNVLRVATEEAPLLLKHRQKIMRSGRHVLLAGRPQLLCQVVEGVRRLAEETEVEDRLWLGQVVALQIVVEPCAWAPEVRDPRSGGEPGADHADDVPRVLLLNVLREPLEVGAVQDAALLFFLGR